MLTVDCISGGNCEHDLRPGFSIQLRVTLGGMMQFLLKPRLNYLAYERFACRSRRRTSTCAAAPPRSVATSRR